MWKNTLMWGQQQVPPLCYYLSTNQCHIPDDSGLNTHPVRMSDTKHK
jgi:hypothetical protein